MPFNKSFFAVYKSEHQECSHSEYRLLKLEQWSSHAELTHTIDMICSEIDLGTWIPNKALHMSFVECIANNTLEIGEKTYDTLRDIELNVDTFLKMLNYSAASLEKIELYARNSNHKNDTDFFYSIIFDKFRYKLKDPLDIENLVNILAENSKQINNLTIQIVDEHRAVMESFVKSRKQLESLKLFGCTTDVNYIFDNNMQSALKNFHLVNGKFIEKNSDANLAQLESLSLNTDDDNQAGKPICLETLQYLRLKLCFLADFQFLNKCKQLKSVTLDYCYDTQDDKIIHGFLNLPAIEKLVLTRTYFLTLSPCNTLKVLHLEPMQWYIYDKVITQIFELMPNLRYLKVLQSSEYTSYFTDQIYKLMKSVLSNSDLTFVMYRKTFDNYTDSGDIIVVDKDPSKLDRVSFDFETTFFLNFYPNFDVFEPFKEALERDGLDYHVKCIIHHKYDYKEMDF